jgi:hypothetical protein
VCVCMCLEKGKLCKIIIDVEASALAINPRLFIRGVVLATQLATRRADWLEQSVLRLSPAFAPLARRVPNSNEKQLHATSNSRYWQSASRI